MLALSPLRSCLNNGQEEEKGKEDFSVDDLVNILDFDDSFFDVLLPDLEMEPEIFSDFSVPDLTKSIGNADPVSKPIEEEEDKRQTKKPINQIGNKKQKKKIKKPKVDWTPELHQRFVQAVEQLGVEKAVPSRILQLMGTHTLTRHNVASHLQKYRSHQKHLQGQGTEAGRWNQRAVVRPPAMIGYPPPATSDFRHLHVWGHPSAVDQSFRHMWPTPLSQPSALIHHHVPGTPCFPPQFLAPAAPVPGIPGFGLHHHFQNQLGSIQEPESVDAVIGDVLSKPWMPMPLGLKPPSTESVIAELRRQGISRIPPA